MPQMAPISWLMLFIIFSTTFIMFCMMNYYSFMYPSPKSLKSIMYQMNSLNWKW